MTALQNYVSATVFDERVERRFSKEEIETAAKVNFLRTAPIGWDLPEGAEFELQWSENYSSLPLPYRCKQVRVMVAVQKVTEDNQPEKYGSNHD